MTREAQSMVDSFKRLSFMDQAEAYLEIDRFETVDPQGPSGHQG